MKKIASSLAVFVLVIVVSVFPFNTASAQTGGYVGVFGGYTLSPDASLVYDDYNYSRHYNYSYKCDIYYDGHYEYDKVPSDYSTSMVTFGFKYRF